jgi:glycosyltransferase involved in cell wall biosynthesis
MISIVMPLRDAAASVRHAMESIMEQSWREWELIVVDDGSADETPDIIGSFARRESRVRLISTPPLGIAKALQAACGAAAGDWIARMDGDDWMHPQRLAAQMEHVWQNPDLGVVSCLVGYGGSTAGYAAHVEWINRLRTPEEISLRRFVEAPVAHPSVMFRRGLLEMHGSYRDGDFPEDYELWLRWLDAGVRFGKVPQELLVWNDPPGRLSRNDPRYAVEKFHQLKCAWLARWLRANVSDQRKPWLWGAGRITRRRFDPLEDLGYRFAGFIDVDPKKANLHRDGRRVVMADELPERESSFIVAGVGSRGAREMIHDYLTKNGRVEGLDFIHAA